MKLSEVRKQVKDADSRGVILVFDGAKVKGVELAGLVGCPAHEILRVINRIPENTAAIMAEGERGGLPRFRLINDYAAGRVIQELCARREEQKLRRRLKPSDVASLYNEEIDALLAMTMDDLFLLRKEKDRRTSERKPTVDVDFTKYVNDKDEV